MQLTNHTLPPPHIIVPAAACRCISWGPDPDGVNGVFLGKDVPLQAGIMLEAVIKAVTPRIMTWGQYMEAAWFMYNKKVLGNPAYKRYVPDYTKCADHFALHAGEARCRVGGAV
jgi:hypothetical protein